MANAAESGNGGGGIYNDGDLTLNDAVVTGNAASADWGARTGISIVLSPPVAIVIVAGSGDGHSHGQ